MKELKILAAVAVAGIALCGTKVYAEHQSELLAQKHREMIAFEQQNEQKKYKEEARNSAVQDNDALLNDTVQELDNMLVHVNLPEEKQIIEIPSYDDDMQTNIGSYQKSSGNLSYRHIAQAGMRGVQSSGPYSFDVTLPSNVTAFELNEVLKDTGLAGLGEAYVQAEMETGVNAVFLCALTAVESGWGTSPIAKLKNNIGGYGAYDSSPYESAVTFSSREECIKTIAQAIAKNYVSPTGSYYYGTTIAAINTKYSTSSHWKSSIWTIAKKIQDEINAQGNY